MKCNWSCIDLGYRLGTADSMAKEAIEIATLLDTNVSFEFNGVVVKVSSQSDWKSVTQDILSAVLSGKTIVYGKGY